MQSDLRTFKRRAAGHTERETKHHIENLNHLFAPNSTFECCSFTGCGIDLAMLNGATLKECSFATVQLVGANFRGATIENTTFHGCCLRGSVFEGAHLRNVTFLDCELDGTSFLGATLRSEVLFDACDMTGADLRFFESEAGAPAFTDTSLKGVTLSINCEFWNGTFDVRAIADFGRLFARASRDEELIELARRRWGDAEYDALDAYMRRD